MTEDKLYRLSVLVVIFIIFWIIGQREHQGIQSDSSDALQLPGFLRFLFGSPGSGKLYSIRGIMGQLLVFSIMIIYSLNILEYISDRELVRYFLLDSLILAFIWILLIVIWRMKR